MPFLNDWFTIVLIGSLAVMSPGPNFVMTLRHSLNSRRAGIYTALGLAIGDLVHVAYCLIGIGLIISRSILMFNLLKWLGAAYLIYIGIKSLQSQPSSDFAADRSPLRLNSFAATRIGFLTCLLNPKVTLFFLALFTQLIRPNTPILIQVIYGVTVASIEFIWFALVAVAIAQPIVKQRFMAIAHWIDRLMGVMLIGFGIRLAIDRGHQ